MIEIRIGDCMDRLAEIPDGSVQCVVTSPPYFGLRDYGTAEWEGGSPDCQHKERTARQDGRRQNVQGFHGSSRRDSDKGAMNYKGACPKCGARRVDRQIGLEESPEAYAEKMVAVFREVRRVLRDDGTLWLNMGDSYAGSSMTGGTGKGTLRPRGATPHSAPKKSMGDQRFFSKRKDNAKPKDLLGMSWRVAFALQSDGWYLRSDIIWAKPNPMPESVTDRPTKAHEYLFLLSKSARYFYDAEAIREPYAPSTAPRMSYGLNPMGHDGTGERKPDGRMLKPNANGKRNKRTVWSIPSHPFPEAHFATFPPALVEPCVKAGTSEAGCCLRCGAPRVRIVEKSGGTTGRSWHSHENDQEQGAGQDGPERVRTMTDGTYRVEHKGWSPGCDCGARSAPCLVLDPFAGAGTVGLVCAYLNRAHIGIELNPEYAEMARRRIEDKADMFSTPLSSPLPQEGLAE